MRKRISDRLYTFVRLASFDWHIVVDGRHTSWILGKENADVLGINAEGPFKLKRVAPLECLRKGEFLIRRASSNGQYSFLISKMIHHPCAYGFELATGIRMTSKSVRRYRFVRA